MNGLLPKAPGLHRHRHEQEIKEAHRELVAFMKTPLFKALWFSPDRLHTAFLEALSLIAETTEKPGQIVFYSGNDRRAFEAHHENMKAILVAWESQLRDGIEERACGYQLAAYILHEAAMEAAS